MVAHELFDLGVEAPELFVALDEAGERDQVWVALASATAISGAASPGRGSMDSMRAIGITSARFSSSQRRSSLER